MLLVYLVLQSLLEFFPISSSLFLRSLNCFNINISEEEIFIYHLFSGILLILIFLKKVIENLIFSKKRFNILITYTITLLPSIIIGSIVDIFKFIKIEYSLYTQIIFNLISAYFLLKSINRQKIIVSRNFDCFSTNCNISYKEALLLGFFTSLNGILPGLSRLGMSLLYLIYVNKNILFSFEFSLITSIPVIMGKPIVMLYKDSELCYLTKVFFLHNIKIMIFTLFFLFILYKIVIKKLYTLKFLEVCVYFRMVFYIYILIYFTFSIF